MTSTDYIIDLALIGLVVLQIPGRRFSLKMLLIPVGLVTWACSNYLHGIPTAGNDLMLVIGCAAVGVALGVGCGMFKKIESTKNGIKAGFAAAALWIVGVGARFAFQVYATHGGGTAIAHFSQHHDITSNEAWVAALLLMAMGEALCRTAVVTYRVLSAHPAARAALTA